MVRRSFSQCLSVRRIPVVAAVFVSGIACGPQVGRAGETALVPDIRPVVALASVARVSDPFSQLYAAAASDPGVTGVRNYLRRQLTPPGPVLPSSSSSASGTSSGALKFIMVADADPYFERWQKDANERLKEEAAVTTQKGKQHPFALAHPDKAVVVCEAGCKTPKDEIVYIAAVVPAVLPQAKFAPSSSGGEAQPVQVALDDGAVPCIAGCYERPERNKPSPRRKAESPQALPPVSTPVNAPTITGAIRVPDVLKSRTVKTGRMQAGRNGAIVEVRKVSSAKLARRSAAAVKVVAPIAVVRGWRTKVVIIRPAKRTVSAPGAALRRLKHTERIRRVPVDVWRTKLVMY